MNKLDKSCGDYRCENCPCNDLPRTCSTVSSCPDEPMINVLHRDINNLKKRIEQLETLFTRCDEKERSEKERSEKRWWKTKEEEEEKYDEMINNEVKSINKRQDLYEEAWVRWINTKKPPLREQHAFFLGRATALQDATAYHWDELPKQHLYTLLNELDKDLENLEYIAEEMKGGKSNGKKENT